MLVRHTQQACRRSERRRGGRWPGNLAQRGWQQRVAERYRGRSAHGPGLWPGEEAGMRSCAPEHGGLCAEVGQQR